jgi:hypothetical protein
MATQFLEQGNHGGMLIALALASQRQLPRHRQFMPQGGVLFAQCVKLPLQSVPFAICMEKHATSL